MMLSPEHKTRTEYRFDAFCKKAMKFEARNSYKANKRKSKHEVSLNYLMDVRYFEPSSLDDYSLIYSMQNIPTHFHINGQIVTIENEQLATALLQLSKERRELVLLYYFLGVKEKEIAAAHGRNRRTINYHKQRSLKFLRQEMERLKYEETEVQVSAL